jgi:general secretion pathway protein D
MTPSFVANVEEVKQLLQEAQGFYATGRYDLAFKRYEQVLNVDKYNIAARRGMEQVNVARQKYADTAYSEARSDMMRQINKAWELPVKKFEVVGSQIIEQPQLDARGTSAINRKLDDLILPTVNFSDATIREALNQLKRLAAAADKDEADPNRKGVNIVLKLSKEQEESTLPLSLTLSDIPLREAIRYVASAANLKVKVDPYSVVVVPLSEPTDVLMTKEYKVPPSFISSLPATASTPGVAAGSQSVVGNRSGAREFLETQGVTFPDGASANFVASTSRLIVKNTQANLDLVDTLVENSLTAPASQVEIEAKFLEVTQNNLKELGFDWLLGQFALPFGTGVYGGGGTTSGGSAMSANSFPFMNSTGVPTGATSSSQGPITAGNRSGSTAISANAVDALLFSNPVGTAPAVLALAGVFTNPQFQVVLRALNQAKGVDLVSAPKVTTKSGLRATIEIVREFRYPTEYDLPQVAPSVGISQYSPVTPTTPTAFEMKPTGITLEVEPTVGPDGYTIELVLAPRVIEFDGFINYGSPISTNVQYYSLGALLGQNVITVTQNTINQPVFSTREVTTQVSVRDGSTVVMGGLMREDVQKTQDKVPIIGDVPLVGRLFRTTADQHIKRNLIMFVTASLIDPAGQPLIRTDEEDQVVSVPNAAAVEAEAIPGDALSVPLPQ